jgi:hypothetical protein
MEQHGAKPDMVAYTSVLNAYSKCTSRQEKERAASRAIAIMKKMEELYAQECYYAKPSLITYSTAINAIGNSLDPYAPELAENMLRHLYDLDESKAMTGIKPSTATFNAVITAMARSRLRRGRKTAQRAEKLLVETFKRSQQGEKNVEPNAKTWGGVILAWYVVLHYCYSDKKLGVEKLLISPFQIDFNGFTGLKVDCRMQRKMHSECWTRWKVSIGTAIPWWSLMLFAIPQSWEPGVKLVMWIAPKQS